MSATTTAAPFPTCNNANIIEKPIEANVRYWKTHLHKYPLAAGCVLATFTWFTWLFFLYAMLFSNSVSVLLIFSWIELQMLLRCCLIHISIIIVRHFLYTLYLCSFLDLGLFMSYICDLFFIFFFIFITINCIISWTQTHLLFF